MKLFIILFILSLTFCCCESPLNVEKSKKKSDVPSVSSPQDSLLAEQDTFTLVYSYAGLGSGYGSMQPTFRVTGTNYAYHLEQNSSLSGEFHEKPQLICTGKLRTSSIDSIIHLVEDIQDTLVYKTNPEIMSGGLHSIVVKDDKINVTFSLHNAFDPTAQKIVDVLNSNIP